MVYILSACTIETILAGARDVERDSRNNVSLAGEAQSFQKDV